MQKTDVLIVFANPVLFPPAQPYGPTILASALRRVGLRCEIVQPFMCQSPTDRLRDDIERLTPEIVGLSFRNLDTAGCHFSKPLANSFLAMVISLADVARQAGKVLAIGGSGFSIHPGDLLRRLGGDVGFVGPSAVDFTEFCQRALRRKMPLFQAVAGLPTAFLPGTPSPRPSAQPLLAPDALDGLGIEHAKLSGGTIPLRTKTGCSLKCTYCVVPQIERTGLRRWTDIRDELSLIVEAGLGERVFIADGEFNLPSVERAIRLCSRIGAEFGSAVSWRCYLEAGYVTAKLLESMRESGCVGISLTLDSFADAPRRGLGKGTAGAVATEAADLCARSGIKTGVNLLFGGPHETLGTAIESAKLARGLNDRGVSVMVTIGLRVYPGTLLARLTAAPPFRPFFRADKEPNWLGTFCSPVPAPDLAEHVLGILPPSETIHYTDALTDEETQFHRELALGSVLLYEQDFSRAEEHFSVLRKRSPDRPEAELGWLKATHRCSTDTQSVRTDGLRV